MGGGKGRRREEEGKKKGGGQRGEGPRFCIYKFKKKIH